MKCAGVGLPENCGLKILQRSSMGRSGKQIILPDTGYPTEEPGDDVLMGGLLAGSGLEPEPRVTVWFNLQD